MSNRNITTVLLLRSMKSTQIESGSNVVNYDSFCSKSLRDPDISVICLEIETDQLQLLYFSDAGNDDLGDNTK